MKGKWAPESHLKTVTIQIGRKKIFQMNLRCSFAIIDQCNYRLDEPSASNMDISTGHMVLAYMEDHLKNKQRLEQEWVALCGYEAEPSATTVAFKVGQFPPKLYAPKDKSIEIFK